MNTKSTTPLHRRFRRFRKAEDGAITLLNLYFFLGTLAVGAIALDVAHLVSARTQLQTAADIAAHTAIYYRDQNTAEDSKAKAVELAAAAMHDTLYGDVLNVTDVSFGYWHADTQTFEFDKDSTSAVMVNASRSAVRGNSVASFLFHFVGMDTWNIVTPSVFETYRPTCFREGLVGEEPVAIQSGNLFVEGFCVHSNDYVTASSGNEFEPGTIVSMPRISDLDIPASGFETNDGLEPALRSGSYNLGILKMLEDGTIEDLLRDQIEGNKFERDYITSTVVKTVAKSKGAGKVLETDFTAGRIHTVSCASGGNTLTFDPTGGVSTPTPFHDFILITDCDIKFSAGTILEDVVILTTSTAVKSISGTNGVQIGKNDNCAKDGGANVLTHGGMSFPSDLKVYSSQLIALKTIDFEANANGLEGAAMVSGGEILGSSGGTMGFCGGDAMDNNFEAEYFRMAK